MKEKINQFEKQFFNNLTKLLKAGDKNELLKFLSSDKFITFVLNNDVNKFLNEYYANANKEVLDLVRAYSIALKVDQIKNISAVAQLIIENHKSMLLGNFTSNIKILSYELIKNLVGNKSTEEALQTLKEKFTRTSEDTPHILTDANINTAFYTGVADIERSITYEAFKDDPEQRFKYFGGILPTSSKQCKWLMENQKPEGYTFAEIDKGIETPFGVINWYGRKPNYNCIHTWLPIKKEIKIPETKSLNPNNNLVNNA